MKVKQKNLRVFEIEIDSYEEFIDFIEKNGELFSESFLLIKGNICQKVESYLVSNGYCYKNINDCHIKSSTKESFELLIKRQNDAQLAQKTDTPKSVEVIKKPVRSGEILDLQSYAIILSRINSGAKIRSSFSLELYDKIDGVVECSGEYLIVKDIGLGVVKFHAQNIDRSILDGKIKFIEFKKDTLEIKDIS